MGALESPPLPAMAANAANREMVLKSISGRVPLSRSETKIFSVSAPPTGTVPNLRKPLKISLQVERLEWKIPRIERNPRTTTILNVMTARSEL